MAVAGGGAGRASVLVFTMPFWTLLIAWPVLHERVRGARWFAVAFAFAGLVLVVAPWHWQGGLASKLWAVLSGFGWAAGTVATKYYQRKHHLDMLNFVAWQMMVGVIPLTLLPWCFAFETTAWSMSFVAALCFTGAISTGLGFVLWIAVLRHLPAGTASLNMFAIPVIALISSMAIFGERLTADEWAGIACLGVASRSCRRSRSPPYVAASASRRPPRPRRSTAADAPPATRPPAIDVADRGHAQPGRRARMSNSLRARARTTPGAIDSHFPSWPAPTSRSFPSTAAPPRCAAAAGGCGGCCPPPAPRQRRRGSRSSARGERADDAGGDELSVAAVRRAECDRLRRGAAQGGDRVEGHRPPSSGSAWPRARASRPAR